MSKAKAQNLNLSEWLTKQQAAESIGVSTKTIEKLAANKKLHNAKRALPGRPSVVVYHPADVEAVRRERNPEGLAFVVPSAAAIAETPQAATGRETQVRGMLEAFAKASPTSQVRIAERLFLTLPEASIYSGLPRTHLQNLIREGKLAGLKTGAGWRIRRKDLEAL